MADRCDLYAVVDHVEEDAVLPDSEAVGGAVILQFLDVRDFGKVGKLRNLALDPAFERFADLSDLFERRLSDDDLHHALRNSSSDTVSSPLVFSTIL